MEVFLAFLVVFVGGGGIGAYIEARSKSKVNVVTSALSLVTHYETRITKLESRIEALEVKIEKLEEENYILRLK